jgi:hypothetical protein
MLPRLTSPINPSQRRQLIQMRGNHLRKVHRSNRTISQGHRTDLAINQQLDQRGSKRASTVIRQSKNHRLAASQMKHKCTFRISHTPTPTPATPSDNQSSLQAEQIR